MLIRHFFAYCRFDSRWFSKRLHGSCEIPSHSLDRREAPEVYSVGGMALVLPPNPLPLKNNRAPSDRDLSADSRFPIFSSCNYKPCVYESVFACFAAFKMSKKKQDNWQLCELCGRLLYSRHLSDHKALCEGDLMSESPRHAFIQDGVLHAVAVERNNKMFSGEIRNINDDSL